MTQPIDFGEFREGELLRGAKAIAAYLFKDESRHREIYPLAETGELPIFILNGRLTARTTSLARAIIEEERRAVEAKREAAERRQQHPGDQQAAE
jgi:hypothetical protein